MNDVVLQADKSAFKAKKIGGPLPGNKAGVKNGVRPGGLRETMATETLDFNKKILHASWHPRENTIAVRRLALFPFQHEPDVRCPDIDRGDEQLVPVQRGMMSLHTHPMPLSCHAPMLHARTHPFRHHLHNHVKPRQRRE